MSVVRRQNETLNAIKAVACVCVVFMHCEFPGILGIYVQAISRWCVPFFFMIAGYFCLREDGITYCSADKVWRKFLHILTLIGWTALFYCLVTLAQSVRSGQNLFSVTPKAVVKLLVFNIPVVLPGQMWFLFALAQVYLFVYCLAKLKLTRLIVPCGLVMAIGYLVLAQGFYLAEIRVPNHCYRNWMVEGMAFFAFGILIRRFRAKVKAASLWWLVTTVIVSTFLCVVERKFMGRDFGVQVCSFVQVVAIFMFAVSKTTEKKSWLTNLGVRYSMLVYVLHPFVWHSVEGVYRRMDWNGDRFAMYMMPIGVVLLTFVLSSFVNMMNRQVRRLHA